MNQNNFRTIDTQCPICKEKDDITVLPSQHDKWVNGTLIQDAFPTLNADQREQLMTGICPPCWEKMS